MFTGTNSLSYLVLFEGNCFFIDLFESLNFFGTINEYGRRTLHLHNKSHMDVMCLVISSISLINVITFNNIKLTQLI